MASESLLPIARPRRRVASRLQALQRGRSPLLNPSDGVLTSGSSSRTSAVPRPVDHGARSSPNVVDRSAIALCLWIDSSASDFTRIHADSGILG